jgi:hypothetical protein
MAVPKKKNDPKGRARPLLDLPSASEAKRVGHRRKTDTVDFRPAMEKPPHAPKLDISQLRGDAAALLHLFFPGTYNCSSWMPKFLHRRLVRGICTRNSGETPNEESLKKATTIIQDEWQTALRLEETKVSTVRQRFGAGLQASIRSVAQRQAGANVRVYVVALKAKMSATHLTMFLETKSMTHYTKMGLLPQQKATFCSLGANVTSSWNNTRVRINVPDYLLSHYDPMDASVIDYFDLGADDAQRMLNIINIFTPRPVREISRALVVGRTAAESLLEMLFPNRFQRVWRGPFRGYGVGAVDKKAGNDFSAEEKLLQHHLNDDASKTAPSCHLREWVSMHASAPDLMHLSVIAASYQHIAYVTAPHVSLFFVSHKNGENVKLCSVGAELIVDRKQDGTTSNTVVLTSPDKKLSNVSSWGSLRMWRDQHLPGEASVFASFEVDNQDIETLIALLPEKPSASNGSLELKRHSPRPALLDDDDDEEEEEEFTSWAAHKKAAPASSHKEASHKEDEFFDSEEGADHASHPATHGHGIGAGPKGTSSKTAHAAAAQGDDSEFFDSEEEADRASHPAIPQRHGTRAAESKGTSSKTAHAAAAQQEEDFEFFDSEEEAGHASHAVDPRGQGVPIGAESKRPDSKSARSAKAAIPRRPPSQKELERRKLVERYARAKAAAKQAERARKLAEKQHQKAALKARKASERAAKIAQKTFLPPLPLVEASY